MSDIVKSSGCIAKDLRVPVLALDLGTKTGWAIQNSRGAIMSGVLDFKGGRYEGGGMRFVRFSKALRELCEAEKIQQIHFEEVRRHLGVDAAHIYGGFLAVLSTYCETENISYSGIPVGTIKKYITGKGNASKKEMVDHVRKRGFLVTDHNEADALSVLLTALNS
jgi:Holliday junction resolvasome RuvABC endonuclease subunit